METELRKRGALVTDHIDVRTNWLDPQTLSDVRGQVPLVYVDAVPVRVDDMGQVTHVGMLLRQAPVFDPLWLAVEREGGNIAGRP